MPDIHTCNQLDRVGEQTSEVITWMVRSRNQSIVCNGSMLSWISWFEKSGHNAASDGLNNKAS
jgi:hypothetical protein